MKCPHNYMEWTKTRATPTAPKISSRKGQERLVMESKDCSFWKMVECATSQDCPEKCGSGKTCWEVSFLHNNWQKVFEKFKHCKVFKQNQMKYK